MNVACTQWRSLAGSPAGGRAVRTRRLTTGEEYRLQPAAGWDVSAGAEESRLHSAAGWDVSWLARFGSEGVSVMSMLSL